MTLNSAQHAHFFNRRVKINISFCEIDFILHVFQNGSVR